MRIASISALLSLALLTGCMTLQADIPEDVIRVHAAAEHDIELAAMCSHEGKTYSEGAITCMAEQRMTCDPDGRWIAAADGGC